MPIHKRDDALAPGLASVARVALILGVLFASGCGADGAETESAPATDTSQQASNGAQTAVSLDEYVMVGPTALRAGTVTLAVVNDGTENHQLTIVAAESYESLPRRENGSIEMEKIDPSLVATVTEPLFAGFPAEQVSVDLEPGSYVFFCNIQSFTGDKSHAGLGQRLVVTVN